jgi:two-component system, OmpR family, alkaline phosphatase synthesis response regulator PhoP
MSKKILVVDDDPSITKLLESILSGKGFEVVKANDGAQALEQVKIHNPKLIVLDIMMPGMNGYDVCRNLKFDSPYKDTPILLLTSRDQEIDPRIGQMMGIEYLQKPVSRELFLNKVEQILK